MYAAWVLFYWNINHFKKKKPVHVPQNHIGLDSFFFMEKEFQVIINQLSPETRHKENCQCVFKESV